MLMALVAMLTIVLPAGAQVFYKVEKKGVDKPSYILGTHHFAPVEFLDSLAGFPEALASVDKIYGELKMDEAMNPMAMMKFQGMMVAPADSTLDKLLTPAQLDSLNTYWDKLTGGMVPLSGLYKMKPALISTQISALEVLKLFPDRDPTAPGLDQKVQDLGTAAGKETAGLETVEMQVNLLYGSPIANQAKDLMESLSKEGKLGEQAKKLTETYLSHNLDALATMILEEDSMDEADLERMIFARNANWADILVPEMAQHPLFVVVGAGHLPSERGLLQLLRGAGYTVTPLDK